MAYRGCENVYTFLRLCDPIDWSELCPSMLENTQKQLALLRYLASQNTDRSPSSSNLHAREESLDDFACPKLVETFLNRNSTSPKSNQLAVVNHFHDRSVPIPSSTDLVEVNDRYDSEQRWLLSLLKIQGTHLSMDMHNKYNQMKYKMLLTKPTRKLTHTTIIKKKPSKPKGLILHERMMRKQARANGYKFCEVMMNPTSREFLSMINFNGFPINAVPHVDGELLKKLAALTCMSSNHRATSEISITEDNVVFRPDLHEQMKNMSIDMKNESKEPEEENNDTIVCNAGFIDNDTIEATNSLKISDEPQELVDNTLVKVEPCDIKFTKKFREYCTNIVTSNLKSCLDDFLNEMTRLQKKMYDRNKVKGKSKRRYYAGIKEVRKHIELKKIKFVIIATDLEKVQVEGGLDDSLNKLIGLCKKYEVPHCFGLGRRKLGYFTYGKGFASCIGIANYSSAEEKLKNVLCSVVEARNEFFHLMSNDGKTIDVEKLLPKKELLLSEMINAYLRIIASTI